MSQTSSSFENRILAALPSAELDWLRPHLQRVDLPQRHVLYEVGQPFEFVYFMEQGVASILTMMEHGGNVEVGMVGFEGMTPVAALFGDDVSDQHTVIQLPGHAFKIKTAVCRSAFDAHVDFRRRVLRFAGVLMNLGAQTAACNRLHAVEQRLARWLLMSSDRYRSSDALPLTQEYMAAMLGVRRAGVNEAVGALQRLNLVRHHHGHITILDHQGLEAMACECYHKDRKRFDGLLTAA